MDSYNSLKKYVLKKKVPNEKPVMTVYTIAGKFNDKARIVGTLPIMYSENVAKGVAKELNTLINGSVPGGPFETVTIDVYLIKKKGKAKKK